MGRLQSEITATQKEIELARQDLDVLYDELGQMAALLRQSVTIAVGAQQFHEFCTKKSELEEVQVLLAHVRNALLEIDDRSNRVSSLKASVKVLDQEYAIACAKAGAIAFEAAIAGTLPPHLEHMMPSLDDQQKQYAKWQLRRERAERSSLGSKLLINHLSHLHERFCSWRLGCVNRSCATLFRQIGKVIDESGCVMDLPGPNAPRLSQELASICSDKNGLNEEIELQQKQIDAVKGSLNDPKLETRSQSASRRIDELEKQQKERVGQLQIASIAYGRVLAEDQEKWTQLPGVTQQTFDCLDQIGRHQWRIQMLSRHIETLEIDIQIEELELIISQDAERIGHLKDQIGAFQRQIVEVQNDITSNRFEVDRLRGKKGQIAYQQKPQLGDGR